MQDKGLRGGNLLAIKGADHTLLTPPNAGEGLTVTNADTSTINNALEQSLSGQTITGYLNGNGDGSFSGDYISEPLYLNGQNAGPIIGSFVIGEAKLAPSGYTPGVFLANVNQAIVLSGLIVALAVVIFSLLLARGITKPLERLTLAAEQVKSGNYAERVPDPVSQDEMGRLAQTFNEMANRIEFDVTELRRQEQLRRDMIANIAHDLATPLTAIQGFSEALADNVIEAPTQRQETAQLIGREVQRMRRLVGDMQHMTLLESRQTRLELAPLDLYALAEETLEVIRPECEQAGIELRNELSRDLPPLLADSDRITQVLLNLLDNARRYTPSGGSITLGAEAGKNQVTIWVADTGSGIGKDDLSHIFERFYRADRSRTGRTGGSGLGLSIVKAIITAHNGTIQATSQPGHGTKISFTLPVSKANITRPLEVSEASHP
jgi:signal transduction histidine kinase